MGRDFELLDRILLVGERPGGPREYTTTMLPWWRIYRTVARWFEVAGFADGDLKHVRFENVLLSWDAPLNARTVERGGEQVRGVAYDEGKDVVVTLGRHALRAFLPGVEHDFLRDAGRTHQTALVERFIDVMNAPPAATIRGRVVTILPLPHPSGRNRLFNDDAGKTALTRGLLALGAWKQKAEDDDGWRNPNWADNRRGALGPEPELRDWGFDRASFGGYHPGGADGGGRQPAAGDDRRDRATARSGGDEEADRPREPAGGDPPDHRPDGVHTSRARALLCAQARASVPEVQGSDRRGGEEL